MQYLIDAIRTDADALDAALSSALAEFTGERASAVTRLQDGLKALRRQFDKSIETAGQPEPGAPPRRIDQGAFRLLFTFDERMAEQQFLNAANRAAADGTATQDQLTYMVMRQDYDDARYIDLDDPAVHAALDFYVAWGLIVPERKDEVLSGYTPAEIAAQQDAP